MLYRLDCGDCCVKGLEVRDEHSPMAVFIHRAYYLCSLEKIHQATGSIVADAELTLKHASTCNLILHNEPGSFLKIRVIKHGNYLELVPFFH